MIEQSKPQNMPLTHETLKLILNKFSKQWDNCYKLTVVNKISLSFCIKSLEKIGCMKLIKSVILFLIMSNLVNGQNSRKDVACMIIGYNIRDDNSVQILNQETKSMLNESGQIISTKRESIKNAVYNLPEITHKSTLKVTDYEEPRFCNITELIICRGVGEINAGYYTLKNEDYSFGLRSIIGYQPSEYFTLGVGLGIDQYRLVNIKTISFDMRVATMDGKFSPLFIVNIGYGFDFKNGNNGWVVNPSFGIRNYISGNRAFLFSVGYKRQFQDVLTYYNNGYGYSSRAYRVGFDFITFSTGLLL